jgi:preprotein translocase subunit SecA
LSKAEVLGVHGLRTVNVYVVQIRINNGNIILNRQVTECDELSHDGQDGFLIGMDIINLGDFSITNDKNTVMSFQIPSTHKHDYVKEYKDKYNTPVKVEKQPERNELCPCGSGKKYKHCCMKKNT